ncbi:hypothetical protein Bca52824_013654 [Brassica carinata]|uniref:Uncharacterized protein n=1 Tax=Brassica carinata TaxID=52824 RepID=A0A8X7VZR5_BRACI|nr:hypothetical protein Bca52824_013654 [Brassica carinata]
MISILEDSTHSPNKLAWKDEVEDEAVDNLVRLIQEDHVFKKKMFGGDLTNYNDSKFSFQVGNLFKKTIFGGDLTNYNDSEFSYGMFKVSYLYPFVSHVWTNVLETSLSSAEFRSPGITVV